jgi:hypothetical protein
MRNRFIKGSALVVAGAGVLAVVFMLGARTTAGQAARPARTTDGKPNLNGIWKVTNTANWDLLAHTLRPVVPHPGVYPEVQVLGAPVLALGAAGGIVPPGPGVVEGNEIPYKPEAAARKKENAAKWLDRDPEARCYLPGTPRVMYMPYPLQIVHGTSNIFIQSEFAQAHRVIHMTKMPPPPDDTWMGFSQGRWEGDTLVVNVSDFNDKTWFSRSGDFHSDKLKLTERYTAVTPDAIRYEVTVEDPEVFTRPWRMTHFLYRQLEPNAQLMDYKCVELVEETFWGHLRKNQLVKRYEGATIVIDITRKVPPLERLYDIYGN